ncbi:YlcI/YnfO family protein [Spirochaeta lutea]|uniref:CopG family transcriptional regulator n=1 Tax=Spirochaeta lutea TaxID=1480694 RepID=A0A098QVW1_9SPIO|nr:YlcI/YnfO family protein [Spirochaeta lutea]KGE71543.1 CopG family transcriptional regulator [Spirochaeta lutea]
MSTLSIRIPDSLHASVKRFSKEDHVSINQFIAAAVAEKITALETENYLSERAQSGSTEKFKEILKKVPNIEPEQHDK